MLASWLLSNTRLSVLPARPMLVTQVLPSTQPLWLARLGVALALLTKSFAFTSSVALLIVPVAVVAATV